MADAIIAAANELNGLDGKSALVIVCDAEDVGSTVQIAATSIKEAFTEQLCTYPILLGDGSGGRVFWINWPQFGGGTGLPSTPMI